MILFKKVMLRLHAPRGYLGRPVFVEVVQLLPTFSENRHIGNQLAALLEDAADNFLER